MANENQKPIHKLPESTIRIMEEAQKSYKRLAGSIANMASILPKFPKIDISKFQILDQQEREIVPPLNYDLMHEQNEWKRHIEILDVQNVVVETLSGILKEQKSTTKLTLCLKKLTWAILILTMLGIVATVIFSIMK
ncbi:MAG: hypothetical protein NTZ65_02235 [Candidatus Berkelbacteria bacterium]|nr:hypothetical protein [Candidatus Berkelbacteria bacterium]